MSGVKLARLSSTQLNSTQILSRLRIPRRCLQESTRHTGDFKYVEYVEIEYVVTLCTFSSRVYIITRKMARRSDHAPETRTLFRTQYARERDTERESRSVILVRKEARERYMSKSRCSSQKTDRHTETPFRNSSKRNVPPATTTTTTDSPKRKPRNTEDQRKLVKLQFAEPILTETERNPKSSQHLTIN